MKDKRSRCSHDDWLGLTKEFFWCKHCGILKVYKPRGSVYLNHKHKGVDCGECHRNTINKLCATVRPYELPSKTYSAVIVDRLTKEPVKVCRTNKLYYAVKEALKHTKDNHISYIRNDDTQSKMFEFGNNDCEWWYVEIDTNGNKVRHSHPKEVQEWRDDECRNKYNNRKRDLRRKRIQKIRKKDRKDEQMRQQ